MRSRDFCFWSNSLTQSHGTRNCSIYRDLSPNIQLDLYWWILLTIQLDLYWWKLVELWCWMSVNRFSKKHGVVFAFMLNMEFKTWYILSLCIFKTSILTIISLISLNTFFYLLASLFNFNLFVLAHTMFP